MSTDILNESCRQQSNKLGIEPQPWVWSLGLGASLCVVTWLSQIQATAASHSFIKNYEGAQTCAKCHDEAAQEVMATSHWTWEHIDPVSGQKLGKRHIINNFCIALPSNEPRCTSCHVGVGYSDKNFDFTDATKVDCLICHDTTGEYKKFPAGSGYPVTGQAKEFPAGSGNLWQPVDLVKVAQNVGMPSRANCGACHFFGGGGDAVKHGDIDSSLYNPTRQVDVHMATDGLNFSCTSCHETTKHQIPGTHYAKDYTDNQMCEKCHTATPHKQTQPMLDTHTDRVACQTCHIPLFARGDKATKMFWDRSTAGQKDANGKNMVVKNADGEVIYDTQKGDFVWERNVAPEYVWFNGGSTFVTMEDVVDASQILPINRLHGDINDAKARIFPVKRFKGIQPYDAGAKILAVPHLFPVGTNDTTAYWKAYDWNKALATGMEYVGKTYSGNLGWVQTEMYWIQNHMVAPKEQALSCASCHVPQGRFNFAALGYGDRAARLQTLYGFEISDVRFSRQSSQVELKWTGTPGHKYLVQYSKDLRNGGAWTDIPNSQRSADATAGELAWSEDLATTADTVRYYRIVRSAQ